MQTASNTLRVTALTPMIGAEVRGVDLADGVGEQTFAEIKAAFLQHQVLFFREQSRLSPEQQIAFGRRFGDLHQHPAAPTHPDHPEIFVIHTQKESKIANGQGWHTDVSCDEEPPMATMLQLHQLPSSGGDTLFASMYAAYDSLAEATRTRLLGLRALLEELFTHAQRPEHIYRFEWEPGSIAFWDNRATWHFAENDYHGHRRLMHRITLEGVALEGA